MSRVYLFAIDGWIGPGGMYAEWMFQRDDCAHEMPLPVALANRQKMLYHHLSYVEYPLYGYFRRSPTNFSDRHFVIGNCEFVTEREVSS